MTQVHPPPPLPHSPRYQHCPPDTHRSPLTPAPTPAGPNQYRWTILRLSWLSTLSNKFVFWEFQSFKDKLKFYVDDAGGVSVDRTLLLQGRHESDSCVPPSSILDIYTDQCLLRPGPVSAAAQTNVSCREDTEADTSKDVSDIESDWDDDEHEELNEMEQSVKNDNDSSKHNNTVSNNNKRSIFIQHKKIKKFSL